MRNFANHPRLFIAHSTIHGLGLFAGEDIEWGRRVIEYQGEPLSTREVKRRQRVYDSIGFTCLMQFGDGLGVDAISGGNESRFINHSRRPQEFRTLAEFAYHTFAKHRFASKQIDAPQTIFDVSKRR